MAKTPKTIQAIMKAGAATEFWKLIISEIDQMILDLQKEMDSDAIAAIPANEYKLAMENIKDKIKHLKTLKNLPESISQNLENPEVDDDPDPYQP